MKTLRCGISVLTVIALLGFQVQWSGGQEPAVAKIGLAEPSHEGQFQAVLEDGLRYWDNGYLIAYGSNHTLETSPSTDGLILYDRDGRVARQPIVWIDGASTVTVNDAAISHSGNLVIAGAASDTKGAIASFIGRIGSDDRLHGVIRTTPFAPSYVCALDDGTVWSYGVDRDEHLNGVQDSLRLRHYSIERGQLEAILKVTTLPDYTTTHEQWRFTRGMPNEVNLRCNSKMVVLYNTRTGDLLELDLKTNATTITKVALLPAHCPAFCITGFALTGAGEMYASFIDRTKPNVPLSGLFRLSRNKSDAAEWVAVPGIQGRYPKESPIYALWGADGDSVVYARQRDGKLYWSRPSSQ